MIDIYDHHAISAGVEAEWVLDNSLCADVCKIFFKYLHRGQAPTIPTETQRSTLEQVDLVFTIEKGVNSCELT